ncbi:MAG: TnsA endonuclease C-terminal domain-containing protein, partial [Coleofasciculus sp. S288]|nr:TnsA endonuclease C-terminal domain-containing protein [Coleofasciculus sp. S288]
GFEPGTSLKVAYHLIANRHWLINMNVPIEPGNILIVENL